MKKLILLSAVALAASGLVLVAQAETSPGRVDFGKLPAPRDGGEFVEVQLRSNLLSLAAQLVEKQEPEAAKLIRSIEFVHVYVIGVGKDNRADLEKQLEQIRADLEKGGWERNVKVQGKKGEDVGVYTKTRGSEAIAGIVITVRDEKNAVLVNLVGDIKPEQVAALGEKLNIQPLKEAGEAIKN